MKNKKAFTLTELLVALAIIGAIAVMAIPSLLNAINNRIHATEMKNFTHSLQLLINNQLIKNRTKNLAETDFESVDKLLTKTNFDIADYCTNADSECWKTTASTNPVEYKTINKSNTSISSSTMKNTIMIKSGAVVAFEKQNITLSDGDEVIWYIIIDVNGSDAPNMFGRDFFSLFITKKGKIIGDTKRYNGTNKLEDKISKCKSGSAGYCYDALIDNGWVMPY